MTLPELPSGALKCAAPDLRALLERVEAATGADRELDRAIGIACGALFVQIGGPYDGRLYYIDPEDGDHVFGGLGDHVIIKPWTASIDAALALVERVLPGWFWRGGHVPVPHWKERRYVDCWAHLSRTDASNCGPRDEATGWHDTICLALIEALLKAKIAQTGQSASNAGDAAQHTSNNGRNTLPDLKGGER